jgi:hypothetical protein
MVPIQDPRHAFDPSHPSIQTDILRMISLYLRSQGFAASAAVVSDEAKLKVSEMTNKRSQLKQLRRAILEADWEAAATLLVASAPRKSQVKISLLYITL